MTRPLAIAVGLLVGLAVGLACERLPVRPAFQSALAALAGTTLASLVSAALWLLRPPPESDVMAVSFGLGAALLTWIAVLLVVSALHAALGWLAPLLHPSVVAHRALLMAWVGALWGALACTSGLGMAGPVR